MKDLSNRSSNIEILRIVLILMVITSHFNYQDMGGALSSLSVFPINRIPLSFLGSISICAVNCFMIISGYFLSENKSIRFSKILDLLIIVVFYRIVSYISSVLILNESFSVSQMILCLIPVNYFAIFYIISYLFSPFLSILFDALDRKKQSLLTFSVILIFIVYPTILDMAHDVTGRDMTIISSISTSGNSAGYSIIQFIAMLITGIYLKRCNVSVKKWILAVVFLSSSLLMTFGIRKFPSLYHYCSLFTVVNAVCLFLFFNQLSCKHSAFINTMSKSVFGIFCLHTTGTAMYIWKSNIISRIPLNQSIIMTLCCWFVSVFVMFIVCLAIDLLRRLLFGKIKSKLLSRLPVISFTEN